MLNGLTKKKIGLIGKKLGMSQVFTRDGRCVPVTVVQAGPCVILQIKTKIKDGYNALQLGFDEKTAKRCNKPMMGHFRKADKGAFRKIVEFRIDELDGYEIGQVVDLASFLVGERIAVTGKSKGRGFQGVMKRHNFGGGRQTHGSMNKRGPGSIGQCAWPARVFKGHKMSGHMGDKRVTVHNLEVVDVDTSSNLILLKGAVPGSKGSFLVLQQKRGNR